MATTTYDVLASPTSVGWSLMVQYVGKTTCKHLGEAESAARDLIIFHTGMPQERIRVKLDRV
ncbi:hypothetical protein [Streptomyces sp. NPDC050564]|uniref:hypothetical protein n=1 Tax=Streptomyces sp. NPDC050564 TaxID=3365631 RepID=UPI003797E774